MAATFNERPHAEHGQRRNHDKVSTGASTCIPMQLAHMQASTAQVDSQGRTAQQSNGGTESGLRSDCWNSPLCPRNMPTNSLTQGILPPSCGGSSESTKQVQQSTREKASSTREVSIQGTSTVVSKPSGAEASAEHGQSSTKRARTTNESTTADIKPEVCDDGSPKHSPQEPANTPGPAPGHTGSKEKRLPHHVIERRYRENLNSQIESLRAAVPSTSACLTLDMEDIGNTSASSAIRPLSKAAVIAHAAEYMRQLAAQNEEVERMNRELRVTVEALRRLVNCEDCGVVQQIVDAGA